MKNDSEFKYKCEGKQQWISGINAPSIRLIARTMSMSLKRDIGCVGSISVQNVKMLLFIRVLQEGEDMKPNPKYYMPLRGPPYFCFYCLKHIESELDWVIDECEQRNTPIHKTCLEKFRVSTKQRMEVKE